MGSLHPALLKRWLHKIILDLFEDSLFTGLILRRKLIAQLLEQPALLAAQLRRNMYVEVNIQIAPSRALNPRHAQPSQTDPRTGLRAFRNLDRLRPIYGVELDGIAERRL